MYKHPLFISWAILLVCIVALHIVALQFFLYWMYSWFDIMMHFLGGLFVSLMTLWFFFESGYVNIYRSIQNVVIIAGGSIVFIGIGWEILEVLAGIPIEENFISDTVTDLIMDVIGASIAIFIFIKLFLHKKENE